MDILNAGNRIMNTYVYPIPEGYVMVDTGYEHSLKGVDKKLRMKGIALPEIQYVFLTHAHDDHAGFLNELLAQYPHIKVILSDRALPMLLKGQNSFIGGCSSIVAFLFCKLLELLGRGKHRFPPVDKQYLNRLVRITPENKESAESLLQGKILFTPGHTSDSISLKVGSIMFCGDAAMNGLPSLKRITIWIEDKTDFENSWRILTQENASSIYPAHGKPFADNDLKKYRGCIRKVKLYELK